MNLKNSTVLKNISYSFLANIVSMGISALMIMVLPKFLGVADYGIWQLYLFYISYLGIFHFGWLDGIYLRYGGCYLEQLDKRKFSSQFLAVACFEMLIAAIGFGVAEFCVNDVTLRTVLKFASMVLVPTILFTFCSFILQITNHIKQYAQLVLFEKLLFFVLVMCYLLFEQSYFGLLCIHIVCVLASMCYGRYLVRNLFINKFENISSVINESYENINVGSKLLIANLAGMLMLGIVRFGISQEWDVITFGKVSLTLSISNFVMIFINSLSVVFFPMLKRIEESEQRELYEKIRVALMMILFTALLGYYPLKAMLTWWLPKYKDALVYMAILFPICLFESKVVLLTNTYLKSLRKEATMMKINFCTVLISILLTYVSAKVVHNLDLMVLSILLLFVTKSVVSELFIGRYLNIKLSKYITQEIILAMCFVAVNYFISNLLIGICCYTLFLGIYLFLNKDKALSIDFFRRV